MASRADLRPGARTLRIENAGGASATFTTFGARLMELRVPDRDGVLDDVVLGFDDVEDYREHVGLYFGATIGRVAGRIADGAFVQDGRRYQLARNEGDVHLHGGLERSFDKVDWSEERLHGPHGVGVAFEYLSADGEEGYPGELRARSEYWLSDDNELRTVLRAVGDATTPVNLTNHSYWNLAGAGPTPIVDHELMIAAEHLVVMDDALVPTGALDPVAGTAADFRRPRRIGERLPEDTGEPWPGFDSAYALDEHGPDDVVVSLWDPASGRAMDIRTTEPSIQMYTANRVPEIAGRNGRRYRPGNAICLEPQRMPDAVNRPEFDSITVPVGHEYLHVSRYAFHVR
jgi:aldose 1-epimerase